jgi:hypothetical protein
MSEPRNNKPDQDEGGPKTPLYIISYSAMMTILLAFFILLNQLATVREYGLVGAGLGAFKMSFVSSGMPGILTSSTDPLTFNAPGGKYRPENDPDEELAPGENRQRLIHADNRSLEDNRQELVETHRDVTWPLDVRYGEELSAKEKMQLDKLARLVRPTERIVLVKATVVQEHFGSEPWLAAMNWALLAARYLVDEARMPAHRVMAGGRVAPRRAVRPGPSDLDDLSKLEVVIIPPAGGADSGRSGAMNP